MVAAREREDGKPQRGKTERWPHCVCHCLTGIASSHGARGGRILAHKGKRSADDFLGAFCSACQATHYFL